MVQLLSEYDIYVDRDKRDKLRVVLQSSSTKGSIYLLARLVAMVFSSEELANSCGQGLHKSGAGDSDKCQGRPPLDATKLSACKGES